MRLPMVRRVRVVRLLREADEAVKAYRSQPGNHELLDWVNGSAQRVQRAMLEWRRRRR